jgi:hypothetical protein
VTIPVTNDKREAKMLANKIGAVVGAMLGLGGSVTVVGVAMESELVALLGGTLLGLGMVAGMFAFVFVMAGFADEPIEDIPSAPPAASDPSSTNTRFAVLCVIGFVLVLMAAASL